MRPEPNILRKTGMATCLAAFLLGGCSPAVEIHGNLPKAEVLESVRAGVSNRQGVQQMLGTPSTIATFENEVWYYIGQQVEQIAFCHPTVLERQVVSIRFDKQGVVREVKRYDLSDQNDVQLVDRETPTKGKELTILEQILGNVGKFNTGEEAQ